LNCCHGWVVAANKVDDVWQMRTFREYYDDVVAAAKSLIEVCCEIKLNVLVHFYIET